MGTRHAAALATLTSDVRVTVAEKELRLPIFSVLSSRSFRTAGMLTKAMKNSFLPLSSAT